MNEESSIQLGLDLEVTEQASKQCSTCRLRYPLHGFNKHGASSDGLRGECRGCHNQSSREYQAWYRQVHGCNQVATWRQANRERSRAWHRAWDAQRRADDDPTERNLESALQADREYRELLTEQGARRRRNEATNGPVPPIES